MSDGRIDRVNGARRGVIAALVLFAAMTLFASPVAATPVSSEPDAGPAGAATTEVETTDVVDTTEVVDTSPPTTDLENVATTGEPDDGLIGADPDPDSSVALLAVVGLVVVLSLAAWWMVRRDEDRPVPDPPEGELI